MAKNENEKRGLVEMNNQKQLSNEDLLKLMEACEIMLTKFQVITEKRIDELKELLESHKRNETT